MLTITPAAAEYIRNKNRPVFLELAPTIGCCIHLRERPSVRFGRPHDPENYSPLTVAGITLSVPHDLPDIPLTISLTTFLGLKSLVVEGWQLA